MFTYNEQISSPKLINNNVWKFSYNEHPQTMSGVISSNLLQTRSNVKTTMFCSCCKTQIFVERFSSNLLSVFLGKLHLIVCFIDVKKFKILFLMVSSHWATPRTIPTSRPTTIIMGSTVIWRALHTAVRPCHWCHWLLSVILSVSLHISFSGVAQCEHTIKHITFFAWQAP